MLTRTHPARAGRAECSISGLAGVQPRVAAEVEALSARLSRRRFGFLALTAPLLILGGGVRAQAAGSVAGSGTITGRVEDLAGSPISGASVDAAGHFATTGDDGTYTLSGISTGTHSVHAFKPGYTHAVTLATVARRASTTAPLLTLGGEWAPGSRIFWNNQPWYLAGANYAWYNYATDFGTGAWGKYTDWNSIAADFAAMRAQGVRVLRWLMFGDGRYSPDWNPDGTVAGLDGYVLPDLDKALRLAADNGIYLLLTLMDSSMWSRPRRSSGLQMGGHPGVITESTVQTSYLDLALQPVVSHVAGHVNRQHVLGYDLINEPEANIDGCWGGVNLQAGDVQAFVRRCVQRIHSIDSQALVTLGGATPYYIGLWEGLGLDFYQFHYYPWMDFDTPPGNGLPSYEALNLDQPCIVGEFPTAATSYGLEDTAVFSARWYLDQIYQRGYAGALGWSYRVGDSATNWAQFQPVYTDWTTTYSTVVGPQ